MDFEREYLHPSWPRDRRRLTRRSRAVGQLLGILPRDEAFKIPV